MNDSRRSSHPPMSQINVVPYIDVMLVLLVIFMITAPLMNPGQIDLIHQTVLRGEEKLVEGEVHLVCVGVDTFKPVSVPDVLRKQWD